MAATLLKKAGYRVDVVGNGRLAVEAVEKKQYDLILMDVQMPVMDGLEATRKIRRQEWGRHNIIIAMTAHSLKGDKERCLDAGMDDYISKPIAPQELFTLIEKWIKAMIEPSPTEPEIKNTSSEEPGSGTVEPPLDMKSAMPRFGNDAAFFNEMLNEFIKYVPEQIASLEESVKSLNADMIEKQSHSIKGAAANLSAVGIFSVAKEIEQRSREKNISNLTPLLKDLKQEIERLGNYIASL